MGCNTVMTDAKNVIKKAHIAVLKMPGAPYSEFYDSLEEVSQVKYIEVTKDGEIEESLFQADAFILSFLIPSKKHAPHVVFIMMEIIKKIREHQFTFRNPIICIDHASDSKRRALAFELGANEYVDDDCTTFEFEARFRNVMMAHFQFLMMENLSTTDTLTKVANRREFDRQFSTEIAKAKRAGSALGLIVIDIDCFKQYNDHCGHPAGDTCIKKVAKALNSQLKRPADLLARVGGEEFAVLLPDCDQEALELVSKRLIEGVSALKIKHKTSPVADYVTISAGAVLNTTDQLTNFTQMYKSADQALYEAKGSGKNRVVFSNTTDDINLSIE